MSTTNGTPSRIHQQEAASKSPAPPPPLSPSLRSLSNHQLQSVRSYMASPSPAKWEELVESMKKKKIDNDDDDNTETMMIGDHRSRKKLSFELPMKGCDVDDDTNVKGDANDDDNQITSNQAVNHDTSQESRIFLKAALQLLQEKEEHYGNNNIMTMTSTHPKSVHNETTSDHNNPPMIMMETIIKIGSLKKASRRIRGVWNVKFVEVRRGFLSYYGNQAVNSSKPTRIKQRRTSAPALTITNNTNNNNNHSSSSNQSQQHNVTLSRKDIPLHASECICRPIQTKSMLSRSINNSNHNNNSNHSNNNNSNSSATSSGAVFEIKTKNRRHLFMANTNEERRHWIRAIHDAMIGASVTRGMNYNDYQEADSDDDDSMENNENSNNNNNNNHRQVVERYLNMRDTIMAACCKEEYHTALHSGLKEKGLHVPVALIQGCFDSQVRESAFSEHDVSSSVDQLWKDLRRDSVDINGQVLRGDVSYGPDRILGTLARQILQFGGPEEYNSNSNSSNNNTYAIQKSDRITEAQAVSYARDILLSSDRTRSCGDSYYCAEHLCLNRNLVVLCPAGVEGKPISISVKPAQFDKRSNYADDLHDALCGWACIRVKKDWVRTYLILGRNMLHCYAKAEPIPHQLQEKLHLKESTIQYEDDLSSQSQREQYSISISKKQFRRDFRFEDESSYYVWRNAFESAAQSEKESSLRESFNICEMEFSEDSNTGVSNGSKGIKRYSSIHVPKLLSRNVLPTVDVDIHVSVDFNVLTLDPVGEEKDDTWATLRTAFIQKFRLSGGLQGRISRGDEVVQLELLLK